MTKTPEEIEKLKESWINDPCWDIEDTKGFGDHYDELLAYRLEKDRRAEAEVEERKIKRIGDVQAGTGITNATIAQSVHTFEEMEGDLFRLENENDSMSASLRIAEVRATLLLAAQVARIADALEGAGEVRLINSSWGDK